MTAGINKIEWNHPAESEEVTFEEILSACRRARVRVVEHFQGDDTAPTGHSSRGFFHQLAWGEEHGPFEHEDQAYEDAFLTYCLWPW